ncbi:RNA-binding protein 7 [Rhinophrynus dorsalis]
MGAAEADRTLFVGNLDPRATEELLFELFLQAGPAINVKIPKDKDGKPKQFAFVNFKHEESVPYGMSLLNGIKLFGRPLKIQFRSGSKHSPQDNNNNSAYSPHGNGNGSPVSSPTVNGSRYDRNGDHMISPGHSPPVANLQRSYSSPDNLQKQAMFNSFLWQQSQYGTGSPMSAQASPSSSSQMYYNQYGQNTNHPAPKRYDSNSAHRHSRGHGSHPYQNESHHYSREKHYRGNQEEYYYDDRVHESRSHEQRHDSRWRSSRH